MAEGRLTELDLRLRPQHALDVRDGDAAPPRRGGLEEPPHAGAQRVPSGASEGAAAPAEEGALLRGAVVLSPGLRPGVGHQGAARVAQKLVLGYGQLHDVADLPEGVAGKKRQALVYELLRFRA